VWSLCPLLLRKGYRLDERGSGDFVESEGARTIMVSFPMLLSTPTSRGNLRGRSPPDGFSTCIASVYQEQKGE
jgi:hypothetical protein